MKKLLFTLAFASLSWCTKAQLADGSTAPDFTFKDINGQTHNLYTYLNQGMYVVIDVSATWCGPCWNYHNMHVLKDLYNAHDIPGDKKAKVLFIEGDVSTTLADLQGTGGSTQGDWVTGTPYPIISPNSTPAAGETTYSSFDAGYSISFFPTLYVICPNKKVWQDTLNNVNYPWPTVPTYEWIATNRCGLAPAGLDQVEDQHPVALYPNPAIADSKLYFSLNQSGDVQINVLNTLGQLVHTQNFTNLMAGDHTIALPSSEWAAGQYLVEVTANGTRRVQTKLAVVHP
ncbi:MAG: T9SS type A sorting domain-containing protein [Chitinophagaceae bacterium]|nr:T9SS type A sorting domain-containing protein [Chitinophagaceae bacterium]